MKAMKPHHRIYGVFFIFALITGALLSRLPDLQLRLGLSEGQLGLTLIAMSVGAMLSLTLSPPVIARLGARATSFITTLGPAAMMLLIPFLPSAPFVAAAFFVAGLFAGALEVNVNLETDRHEARLGYRIMNRAHGMWSIGFFLTALIGAGVRQFQISIETHMIAAFLVVLIASGVVFSGIENAPPRPDTHQGDAPLVAFPSIPLLALCLIGAAPLLVEGAGVDWSGIYMRDVFGVPPFVGGMALAIFTLFMAIARLTMDPVVDRFGPRNVVTTLLCVSGVGLALVAAAPHALVALAGYGLMGVGCSAVYPLAISEAAQRTDRPAATNVAAVSQVSFVVFFLGPPLLGFVAQDFGIRYSYVVCLVPIIAGLFVVGSLSSRRTPSGPVQVPEPISPHG
jgi:MFS family permease